MISKVKGTAVVDGNIYPGLLTEDGKGKVKKLLENKFIVEGIGGKNIEAVLKMDNKDYLNVMSNASFKRQYDKYICDSDIGNMSGKDSAEIISLMEKSGYVLAIEYGQYVLIRLGRMENNAFKTAVLNDLSNFCTNTSKFAECKQYGVSEDDLGRGIVFIAGHQTLSYEEYLSVSRCIDFLLTRRFTSEDIPDIEFGSKVNGGGRKVCCRFGLTCSSGMFKLVCFVDYAS